MELRGFIIKYAHQQGVTVCLKLAWHVNSFNRQHSTLYEDQEIAKFFGISTRTYRDKLRAFGAEQKSFKGFKKRYYLPNVDVANDFINEYLSSLIIADEIKRAGE